MLTFIAKGSLSDEVAKIVGQAIPVYGGESAKHATDKEPIAFIPEGTQVTGNLEGNFLAIETIGGVVIEPKDVYCLAEHLEAA